MAEILQQLRTRVIGLPITASNKEMTEWTLSGCLDKKNAEFFDSLALNRPLLAAQYRVQCAQLIAMFKRESTDQRAFLRTAESALVVAELLEHIYHRLEETDDLGRLRADQAHLRTLLSQRYPQFQSTILPSSSAPSTSQGLRRWVDMTTQPRLVLVRIRRTILAAIVLNELAACRPWVNSIERVTNPFFLHLSWLFFIPRMSLNLMFLGKHVLPHPWMSEKELALPWTTRFQTYWYMHRHSFELANDVGWFLCGVLSCFLCTGAWLPFRVYLAIAMQLGEFVISCLRSGIEISRLNTLEKEYHAGCADGTIMVDQDYLKALRSRIEHENRVYTLEVTRNVLLNLSILTILPIFLSASPFIPIFGAVLAVATSIAVIVWTDLNVKQRPADDLVRALKPEKSSNPKDVSFFLKNHSMFKAPIALPPALLVQTENISTSVCPLI